LKQLEIENELRDVVSRMMSQVELATKQGRLDINLALEDAFIPILKAIFNLPNLINLNRRQKNYPGIDLGDDHDRVAFQVTSTTSLDKVKKTVSHFTEKKFYNSFDELFVLMLVKKQSSYSQSAISKLTEDQFEFDVTKHIIDPGDILEKVAGLRIPTQQRILNDFKLILGEVNAYLNFNDPDVSQSHILTSNLVPIIAPENVYVAELLLDEKTVIAEARKSLNFKKNRYSTKSLVKMALLLVNENTDAWICYEGKIFSFLDIENSSLRAIVDLGSVEILESADLYNSNVDDNVNIFKQLLSSSMQETLKENQVSCHPRDRFFYFVPNKPDEEIRREQWMGKKKTIRKVYEKKISIKDPTKVAYHMHLSFDLFFSCIGEQWYCNIVPSWFYTYNGYTRSRFHESLLSKQKRLEFNQTVRNMVRFIAYFLKEISSQGGNQIVFGDLLELTCEDTLVDGEILGEELEELEEECLLEA
jgi:hypothetical protein